MQAANQKIIEFKEFYFDRLKGFSHFAELGAREIGTLALLSAKK